MQDCLRRTATEFPQPTFQTPVSYLEQLAHNTYSFSSRFQSGFRLTRFKVKADQQRRRKFKRVFKWCVQKEMQHFVSVLCRR